MALREELLARARLPHDKHGGIGVGRLGEDVEAASHVGGRTDDALPLEGHRGLACLLFLPVLEGPKKGSIISLMDEGFSI